MRILVSNDDGIHAEGLRTLVRAAKHLGEVKVSAPDAERSACGHAMTMRNPLRVKYHDVEGCEAVSVDGVPVDCVNVGLTVLYPDSCDLILSGINHGPNLGYDVTYSGTAAAAMEGAINHIRSIAFSMVTFIEGAPMHFETGERWIRENLEMLSSLPTGPARFLNVNIPAIAYEEIQGYRFVEGGDRVYEDRVIERKDPWGRPYFWQGGVVVMRPDRPGTDVHAVSEGYVSITPLRVDWTCRETLAELNKLKI